MATQEPIQVTNNPQNNVQQVANTQVQQPVQQPVQAQNVTPVTIPVQIQPVVAQNNNIQQMQQQTNVPTPTKYTQPTQQTQPIYQNIYDNYQSQYKTEQRMYPTVQIPTVDTNTIEGQYQSQYSNAINQLANTILSARFNYNPNEDDLLKQASKYVTQNTFESMNAKGILNSSMTAERVAQVVGNLIPQYEKLAREEFDEAFSRMLNTANLLMNMDDRQFTYWQDARNQKWKEEEQQYQRSQDALKNAWARVDELGYVDNEASKILGVPVGTLSKDAREKKEAYERQIAEWNRQHEIEKQTEMELYKLKQEISTQNELALYKAKQNLSTQQQKELERYSYELKQEYGGTTSSSNNFSTYDDIIKNRYAEYDDMTKQYVVPDEDSYNQLANYLDNLYASGRISEEELFNLSSKYSKYNGISTNDEEGNASEDIKKEKKKNPFLSAVLSSIGIPGMILDQFINK